MAKSVAGNAAWNVAAQAVSLGVGFVALPVLLRELGTARLGVFTLALGLIGFSGLFDLGLSRALTQTVSSALGMGHPRERVAAIVWRVIAMLTAFGVVWMVALWAAAPSIADRLFSLTGGLAQETVFGLRALAVSIPFVLAAVGAMGALEGLQEFRLLSLWRMPMSLLQFGLPVAVAFVRPNVGWVIGALAVTRVMWMALWLTHLHRLLPRHKDTPVERGDLRQTLRFGGWLSVSNVIGPLMVYADRFYLASIFPPASVAYYTVPFDAMYRMTSLPQTAINALFPALAQAQHDPAASARMLNPAIRTVTIVAFPVALVIGALAQPLLTVWLNATFAASAASVAALLALGIFYNSLAHLPYALLQAHGRSDVTAKLHVLELPVFALALVLGTHALGIVGAALAWTIRVGLDALLLYASAWCLYSHQRAALSKALGALLAATVAFVLIVHGTRGAMRIALTVLVVAACCAILAREIHFVLQTHKRDAAQ